MADLAMVMFWILIGLVVGQALLVAIFARKLSQFRQPLLEDAACPRAAVILCLRGTDPFLGECLAKLFDQDYPDFEVRVMVDSPDDPAWEVVQRALREKAVNNVFVTPLTERRDTCSLKCSSLVQAVQALDERVNFIAQLDADTVPHSTWLRELATALQPDDVGAATGNRWYMPQEATVGSVVRYLWNAAAVVQMGCYGIAWGGTLAVKRSTIEKAGLLEKWSHAFCEDTMLFSQLKSQGLKVKFVPSLMMVNRESCDLSGFFRWVTRQLLTARLYHPGWPAVAAHGVGTSVLLAATVASFFVAMFQQDWLAANWLGWGFGLYQGGAALLLAWLEMAVRPIVHERHETTKWMTPAIVVLLGPALLLTQVVYAFAMSAALVVRRVAWRGVNYQVRGPWKIELEAYRPFVENVAADTTTSL